LCLLDIFVLRTRWFLVWCRLGQNEREASPSAKRFDLLPATNFRGYFDSCVLGKMFPIQHLLAAKRRNNNKGFEIWT
jgi:hypothetical protein